MHRAGLVTVDGWTDMARFVSAFQDLEYLVSQAVDPTKADYAIVTGKPLSYSMHHHVDRH